MKKEKIIMSFVAVLIGLLVAGIAFYLYESSSNNVPPSTTEKISTDFPSPSPMPTIFLTIDSPKDEEVFTQKTITISGKSAPDAIVSVISKSHQDIITPSQSGDFSTTININDDQNLIEITAIGSDGESAKVTKVVTFSTEEF